MTDLLPRNATKPERALSLATGRTVPVPNRTLWSPETCPADILPWLAWSLSVDEWDAGWTESQKRNAIAESIAQHRRKGTVGALRRALQTLGYEVEIDERTGVAYTFRLLFPASGSAGGAVIDQAIDRATAIALRQKNARSALENTAHLATNGATGGPIIVGACASGIETDVTEFFDTSTVLVTGDMQWMGEPLTFPPLIFAGMQAGRPMFADTGSIDTAGYALLFEPAINFWWLQHGVTKTALCPSQAFSPVGLTGWEWQLTWPEPPTGQPIIAYA